MSPIEVISTLSLLQLGYGQLSASPLPQDKTSVLLGHLPKLLTLTALGNQDQAMLLQILVTFSLLEPRSLSLDKASLQAFAQRASEVARTNSQWQTARNQYDLHFQERVLAVLRAAFPDQFETEVSSGFYSFDVYFPREKLVVEINGATHYYQLSEMLLPKYRLKARLVEALGDLNLVDIDFHTFLDANKALKPDEVVEFVRQSLKVASENPRPLDARNVFLSKLMLA